MCNPVDANKRLHRCKFTSLTSLLDLAERKLGLFLRIALRVGKPLHGRHGPNCLTYVKRYQECQRSFPRQAASISA